MIAAAIRPARPALRSLASLDAAAEVLELAGELESAEVFAAGFLRLALAELPPEAREVAEAIASGSWQSAPLAVLGYQRAYREFLFTTQRGERVARLAAFYASLAESFRAAGLLEEAAA